MPRYRFPRPCVTVDLILFTILGGALKVLLIRRANPPFRGRWALPGGFVDMDENLETAARRELLEEAGVKDVYLEQLYTFGEPKRDPRARVITVAYFALVNSERLRPRAASDAAAVGWHPVFRLPKLAFDHREIIRTALQRVRAKMEYSTVGFQLMPKRFTLTELQRVYEIILRKKLDKRNFRKKVLSLGLLKPERVRRKEGAHRPARLYSFRRNKMMILEGQIV
ncbi:MAG: NUDIX hydrolase [Planctomycetota bacterium]|jgi:8-oxo-dGTP diphosphatase